jgi:hypothetical protein
MLRVRGRVEGGARACCGPTRRVIVD